MWQINQSIRLSNPSVRQWINETPSFLYDYNHIIHHLLVCQIHHFSAVHFQTHWLPLFTTRGSRSSWLFALARDGGRPLENGWIRWENYDHRFQGIFAIILGQTKSNYRWYCNGVEEWLGSLFVHLSTAWRSHRRQRIPRGRHPIRLYLV